MEPSFLPENMLLFVALVALSVTLLSWKLKPPAFRAIHWKQFGLAAGLFWGVLAAILVLTSWEDYYGRFTSSSPRLLIPLSSLLVYPLWSLLLRRLTLYLPGNPVITFCLLGGLQSIPEHAIAIYRLNILDLPILRGSTPLSIFIFAYFEYAFFWSLVLGLAAVLHRLFMRQLENKGAD